MSISLTKIPTQQLNGGHLICTKYTINYVKTREELSKDVWLVFLGDVGVLGYHSPTNRAYLY